MILRPRARLETTDPSATSTGRWEPSQPSLVTRCENCNTKETDRDHMEASSHRARHRGGLAGRPCRDLSRSRAERHARRRAGDQRPGKRADHHQRRAHVRQPFRRFLQVHSRGADHPVHLVDEPECIRRFDHGPVWTSRHVVGVERRCRSGHIDVGDHVPRSDREAITRWVFQASTPGSCRARRR